MSGTIVNLIIQIIAGAIGGNGIGAALKNLSLGTAGNTIAGAIGGAAGGTVLFFLRSFRRWPEQPVAVSILARSSVNSWEAVRAVPCSPRSLQSSRT